MLAKLFNILKFSINYRERLGNMKFSWARVTYNDLEVTTTLQLDIVVKHSSYLN